MKTACKCCGDELYYHRNMDKPDLCYSCRALRKTPYLDQPDKNPEPTETQ